MESWWTKPASSEGYKLLVAPMCYMLRDGIYRPAKTSVGAGGHAGLTYFSGYVNQDDLCFLGGSPASSRMVAGIWAEEVDRPAAELANTLRTRATFTSAGSTSC